MKTANLISGISKNILCIGIFTLKFDILIPLSIFCFLGVNVVAQCDPKRDSLVLVELYDSTRGDKWLNTLVNNKKWKAKGTPIKNWFGIKANIEGCVTEINLSSDSLDGILPQSLVELPFLEFISISSNDKLKGRIPDFKTSSLNRIWLYGNQLDDTIPNFKAPNLTTIWLSFNQLKGKVPDFNAPNLENLWLNENQLTGSIPNFNQLQSLQVLRLGDNKLSGSIPNFNLPKLTELYLSDGSLSGNIPDFKSLINLITLNLSYNKLTGSIPDLSLKKLKNLQLQQNLLTGKIPHFDLPNINEIYLNNNRLEGAIPNFNYPFIQELRLNDNKLSGCIPFEIKQNCPLLGRFGGDISRNINLITQSWRDYWDSAVGICISIDTSTCFYRDSVQLVNFYNKTNGENWTKRWNLPQPMSTWFGVGQNAEGCVINLTLSKNNLTNDIPNLNLPNLEVLRLDSNRLSGKIPDFALPSLRNLNLEGNLLFDSIPNFKFKNLVILNLSNNQLSGLIPNFSFDKLTGLYLGNNNLRGPIPNLKLPSLAQMFLYDNNFSNSAIPNFKLDSLEQLSLSGCLLIGSIPNFSLKNLKQLFLNSNQLEGKLPDFDSLPQINRIHLQNNQLEGCIPVSYRRFCPLSSPLDINLSNNLGLPNMGDFTLFCPSKVNYDTTFESKTILIGDSIKLKNGKMVSPQLDIIYQDSTLIGCKGNFHITKVQVKINSNIKTAITPNDDDINDKLDIPIIDWQRYPLSRIEIYNRWSQQVYVSEPYQQDWSGQTNDGKELPEGDYFFILSLKPNGDILKGTVHIFR